MVYQWSEKTFFIRYIIGYEISLAISKYTNLCLGKYTIRHVTIYIIIHSCCLFWRWFLSVKVNPSHWICMTITPRTDSRKFLRQRVWVQPIQVNGVSLPCAVVVQSCSRVKFHASKLKWIFVVGTVTSPPRWLRCGGSGRALLLCRLSLWVCRDRILRTKGG